MEVFAQAWSDARAGIAIDGLEKGRIERWSQLGIVSLAKVESVRERGARPQN
jgi:hypothetical protein